MLWLRRGCFIALLVALAITPGPASAARPCTAPACPAAGHPAPGHQAAGRQAAGQIRWAQPLPGSWVAQRGLGGTTPAQGDAYAAMGAQVTAVGIGSTIYGYRSATGHALWVSPLGGVRAGAQLVSVRAWPGVVTAGLTVPGQRPGSVVSRREMVLSAATGRLIRSYPAAAFGGAVRADGRHTVIVGATAVTSYDNRTGATAWRRPTGPAAQAWKTDGNSLYLTVAAGGYLSGKPVRALRRISLRTGRQRLIRPPGRSFHGVLSRAFDGVVLFTDARGTVAYSGATGMKLWRRHGAVPENADPADALLYLADGGTLVGVDPWTGRPQARVPAGATPGPAGLFAVRDGTVLGLDQGAPGGAWGYGVATQQVLWTSPSVPWPHYFVDLSGIGGSAAATSPAVLLAICRQLGGPAPGAAGPVCWRPELVALNW
jgi:outer membrane protein assembly factor BamB